MRKVHFRRKTLVLRVILTHKTWATQKIHLRVRFLRISYLRVSFLRVSFMRKRVIKKKNVMRKVTKREIKMKRRYID